MPSSEQGTNDVASNKSIAEATGNNRAPTSPADQEGNFIMGGEAKGDDFSEIGDQKERTGLDR